MFSLPKSKIGTLTVNISGKQTFLINTGGNSVGGHALDSFPSLYYLSK